MGTSDSDDEKKLSKLAKRMLATPPKKRADSKLGKPRTKPNAPKAQTKKPGR
jgi:hypothetical protein